MRVLLTGPLPPPIGGMQIFYQNLLQSSLPRRVDLRFVRTGAVNRPLSRSGKMSAGNIFWGMDDCVRVAAAVKAHHPHLAHIGTAFGLSFFKHSICAGICRLGGCRVLLHPHCGLEVFYGRQAGLRQKIIRNVLGRSDGLIVLSREWLNLLDLEKNIGVYYLPNAINLQPFEAVSRDRNAQNGGNSPVRGLYMGNIGLNKGSFDLLEAAAILKSRGANVSFTMVGDDLCSGEWGCAAEAVRKMKLETHVFLHRAVQGKEKLSFFKNADFLIHPSHSEGMPLAVIEAMASGLPIVATRVGGLPDLVKDEINGVLVPPGSPEQLAAAVQKLLLDRRALRCMGLRSRELAAQNYDMENYVTELLVAYESVCQRLSGS